MSSKKYYISWLLATASIGVLIGTVLCLFLNYEIFLGSEWFIGSVCLFIISLVNKKLLAVLLILLSGIIFGLWRGSGTLNSFSIYDDYYGKEVAVSGVVTEDPSIDIDGDVKLRLKNVIIEDRPVNGNLWVSTINIKLIKRSDVVVAKGRLSQGFGNIPAAMYRSEVIEVQRRSYSDVGRDVRDNFAEGVRSAVEEPEASLAIGFLVGQKTQLPEKLNNELKLLGLTHIVVASGYNLTILVRLARRVLEKVSRFTALAGALFLIYGFVQITGWSPSMSRAALITTLSLLAWYFGRKIHPFVLISISAAATVAVNPSYAWGDIGWLLSFTAFLGVIILAPLLHAYFWADKKPGTFRQIFFETMSAQILTLPIIAYIFGQYTLLSLLANVLILPLIPLAMLFTFLAGLCGIFIPGLSAIVGLPATAILKYMVFVVGWLATWPIASSEISFSATALVASYILLFGIIVFLWRRSGYIFRDYNVIE